MIEGFSSLFNNRYRKDSSFDVNTVTASGLGLFGAGGGFGDDSLGLIKNVKTSQ